MRAVASKDLNISLAAGVVTGLVGIVLFGLVHAVLIVPIWSSLARGVPFGLLGGVSLGWAFHELRNADRLQLSAKDGAIFGFLLWLLLTPMTLLGTFLRLSDLRATLGNLEVVLELAVALAAGASLGWYLARQWRPALALGIAVLALAVVMGGPIPVTNSTRAAALFAALAGVYATCGVVQTGTVLALSSSFSRRPSR